MKLLRKAQVGGLQGFILSIVTVAIVLAIGLIVMQELRTTAKELDTTSVSNETVTLSSATAASTGAVSQAGELFISLSAIRNETSEDLISFCNVSTGSLTCNATGSTTCYTDYSHYTPSAAFNSTGSIITKLATVPTWIGIIIIVALAFIVLSFFIGKRQ